MSDFARQSMTDKAGAALKPDSQKVSVLVSEFEVIEY
jgi:hypothetical protein